MRSRQEIKAFAKQAFFSQRNNCILAVFLVGLVTTGYSLLSNVPNFYSIAGEFNAAYFVGLSAIMSVIGILSLPVMLLTLVLSVNLDGAMVKVFYGKPITYSEPYTTLKVNFARKLGGMCWHSLWLFLWAMVGMVSFFIPTIIKSLAYSMTPYILASNPNVPATEALKLSMRMTKGHKGEIFVMGLSFIGWQLLNMLTFGILGIFYVNPYMSISYAGLFVEMRNLAVVNGVIHPSELDGVSQQYAQPQHPSVPSYMQQPQQPSVPPYAQQPKYPDAPPYMQQPQQPTAPPYAQQPQYPPQTPPNTQQPPPSPPYAQQPPPSPSFMQPPPTTDVQLPTQPTLPLQPQIPEVEQPPLPLTPPPPEPPPQAPAPDQPPTIENETK